MHVSLLQTITFLSVASSVRAFSFTFSSPSQCDNLNVNWIGGKAPFLLELVPIFGTPRHVSIPASSFSNGTGSFQTQLPFPAKQQFVLAMSDATGYGTGGTSNVLTTGASVGGQTCNTTDPGVAFPYELNTALQQCRPYTFSAYTGAVQPVTITALIPEGETFTLHPPTGPTSYDWIANVAAGTSIVFIMTDAQGREGGSSDVKLVGNSNDASCVNSNAPASTANPPSETSAIPSSSYTTIPNTVVPSSTPAAAAPTITPVVGTNVSGGAIAGTVVGGLVALASLVTLGLFFLRRKRRVPPYNGPPWRNSRRPDSIDLSGGHRSLPPDGPYPYPGFSSTSVPSAGPMSSTSHFLPSDQYEPDPFILPPALSSVSRLNFDMESFTPQSSEHDNNRSSILSSQQQRKAAMAGVTAYKTSRFILHTDAEEVPPIDAVIVEELPPQYSDRRQPKTTQPPNDTFPTSTLTPHAHLPERTPQRT